MISRLTQRINDKFSKQYFTIFPTLVTTRKNIFLSFWYFSCFDWWMVFINLVHRLVDEMPIAKIKTRQNGKVNEANFKLKSLSNLVTYQQCLTKSWENLLHKFNTAIKDNLGLVLFLILSSQRVLLTSTAVESIHQKLLVVVLLTDYHLSACNKGCRW